MQVISRDELREKMERHDDFALVEVLPPQNYEAYHLPGAINIPLGNGFKDGVFQTLHDKEQPIVVYCRDSACPASPRAAKQLDAMGYTHVFAYAAGKADWKSAGLGGVSSS